MNFDIQATIETSTGYRPGPSRIGCIGVQGIEGVAGYTQPKASKDAATIDDTTTSLALLKEFLTLEFCVHDRIKII